MKRELSYQFDLDIERVHLLINMKCDVQVWWKSGKGKIATKNSIKLTGNQKHFDVREKLSIIAKIVMQNGMLKEKKTQLLIILFTSENTSKLGGRVYLNLAQFVSPDNLTSQISRRFQRSLQNCPDEASKIVFNLSSKYIQQNIGGNGSQNLHDISFQANNFSNSFSTSFSKTVSDMTFRPEKQKQEHYRRMSSYQGQNTQMPNIRAQHSPKQKRLQRDWQKQKIDTPSWDRKQYDQITNILPPNITSGRTKQKQSERPPPPALGNIQTQQRPMEFSFNPLTQADRQRLGFDNTELVRELKQIAEQRGQKIKLLQQQNMKIKAQFDERTQKSSAKSLNLLNQLNSTTAQKQQLVRQKAQLTLQYDQLKQQNKKLQQRIKSMSFQFSQTSNQYINKLDQRKKMIQQLNNKLEQADRRANRYQDELFKKQNEIITKQKQHQASQLNKQAINKQQTEKLKSISIALKELQNNFEKVFTEKEEIRKKYEQSLYKLQKSQQSNQRISQNIPKLELQLQKQKQKSKLIQSKYKQRQSIIQQIENQFKLFSGEKMQIIKQKDDELTILREKFNGACKKLDDISTGEESMKNMVSQKNVRVKTLQGICAQLQKSLQQKQELIAKAKQYVKVKQQQVQQKNSQIVKRDEFIQKIRTYMQNKQKQYNQAMMGVKNNSSQASTIKSELKNKQKMLQQYINDKHRLDKQVQDMGRVIDRLKDRVMECEDTIDELHRKNQSQQSTLKDLVKKNLDMEIQLNIKDYQIQSLRSSR